MGRVWAGEQNAKMMSLVSSARRHDLDVWAYIKDVFDWLPAGETDYRQLLPGSPAMVLVGAYAEATRSETSFALRTPS